MNEYIKPVIFIDQKKYRIRIYKHTLHLLGDPEYIQLLVNPENLTVAVRCANHEDHMTHRIMWENLISNQSCELYSRYFICKLQSVCENWVDGKSYRLIGENFPAEKMIQFDLKDIIPYISSKEADNE